MDRMKSSWKRFTSICNYHITDKELWKVYRAWKNWGKDYRIVIIPYSLHNLTVEIVAYRKVIK